MCRRFTVARPVKNRPPKHAVRQRTDGIGVAWALLHCTLGDVVIALALFVVAGMVLRREDWPASRPWTGGARVVIGAPATGAIWRTSR